MRGRPDPVGVAAEFLRKELAKGPAVVSKLEAMAQAAGLLRGGQSITDAKLFKRAKKSLGIQSVRNGFGSGVWLWRLERQPTPIVAEPSSVAVPRIPSSWIEGVARLDHHRPPTDIPAHRWRQFLGDCNNFLASGGTWAVRLGCSGLVRVPPPSSSGASRQCGSVVGHQWRPTGRATSRLGRF
jgi:hypothetical protein